MDTPLEELSLFELLALEGRACIEIHRRHKQSGTTMSCDDWRSTLVDANNESLESLRAASELFGKLTSP